MNTQRLFRGLIRWGFHQLYHRWAWTYDAVAASVSLGRWYDWVLAVRPFIRGPSVVEVGPGTGHLLRALAEDTKLRIVGLDESRFMLRLARRRIPGSIPLVRGNVQRLPLGPSCVDTIVATFPSDFIASAEAIMEYQRVLRPGGRLVALPVARLAGRSPLKKLLAWVLVLLGETPKDPAAAVTTSLVAPLGAAGLTTTLERFWLHESEVFVVVAAKPPLDRRRRPQALH